MLFSKFNDNEIRGFCREAVETLEYWLRQIVDEEFKGKFGRNYLNATNENGDRIIKKEIADGIISRKASEPNRFPRLIDATYLDDLTALICNPRLFQDFFSKYFQDDLLNNSNLRIILKRIVTPRNHLSHSNPISNRQAEQVLCYCHDIIDSIKSYYLNNKIHMDFNVPRIIQFKDSIGNTANFNQSNPGIIILTYTNDENSILRAGEILEVEINIDESYDRNEYEIRWLSYKGLPEFGNTNKISLRIENHHVGEEFDIRCIITTKNEWHRLFNGSDDFLVAYYKVLPPIS